MLRETPFELLAEGGLSFGIVDGVESSWHADAVENEHAVHRNSDGTFAGARMVALTALAWSG